MDALYKECERVCKKQRTCAQKTAESISRLIDECNTAKNRLAAEGLSSSDQTNALQELQQRIGVVDFPNSVAAQQKELHGALNRFGKSIEKNFVSDITKAMRDNRFDRHLLNQVVAQHLFREGCFELGECFASEAAVQVPDSQKGPYKEMHHILDQIRLKNLEPVLEWVKDKRQQHPDNTSLTSLEFKLHRLQFVQTLNQSGRTAALQYCRNHLSSFATTKMEEIQRLTGCLVYADRLDKSPYADLLSPKQWDDIEVDFTRMCCTLLGQAYESPLAVSIAAGTIALPKMLKVAEKFVMCKNQEWNTCELPDGCLPLEIELPDDFAFHSVFACPVSRDQATPENPPMHLPCGHVLCKVSISKLAKGGPTRTFKCPYCPTETTMQQCKQLQF